MKLLVIDTDSVGLAFCWRCALAGHQVRWFVAPKPTNNQAVGEGFKGIQRIQNWVASIGWADLVVTTGNDDYLQRLDGFRKKGVKVFAPSQASANLEIKRGLGMKFLEDHGIQVPEYKTFKTLADAEKHVMKHEERFVFKTLGDNEDKSLSYCSKSPADMIARLRRWQKLKLNPKGEVMLQKFIPGIEFAVSRWMGKNGFIGKPNENFEHKKVMSGNYGPNCGEAGCYDKDTEVLTSSGWKFWPKVTMDDEIATLTDGRMSFEKPSAVVAFDYVGPMVTWKNRSLDLCVTPNHNMYVNSVWNHMRGIESYEFVQAEDCNQVRYQAKRDAHWVGSGDEYYLIPERKHRKGLGWSSSPEIKVPIKEWAAFLGLYIADGSSSHGTVAIANSHTAKAFKAESVIKATGLNYIRKNNGFTLCSSQLADILKPLGLSFQKHVPQYIKDHRPEIIESFLRGYCIGDGTQKNGHREFYTSSKRLSDDVQELLLKMGRVGMVSVKDRIGQVTIAPDGHEIICKQLAYVITERVKKVTAWLDRRDKSSEMYAGKVYCATVSSHVLYVRRNGKPIWCGNTVQKYVGVSKLYNEVLAPLEQSLKDIGHHGDVDVNCIVDEQGKPWPLEFTCRMGWPAFNIMLVEHKGDPAQWMYDACEGKDTLAVSEDVAVGVIVAQPDYPYSNITKRETEEIPIYGVTKKNSKYLQPQSVKMAKLPDMDGDKVVERDIWATCGDYLMCVTGTGKTVVQAAKRAYSTIGEIEIPDKIARDDIGKKLKEQLPKLQAHGYATEFEYGED